MTAETSRHALQPPEPLRQTDSEPPSEWHRARQRALRYLDHFNLSAFQGLELVLAALQRAQQIVGTAAGASDRHPLEITMRQLFDLLAEKGIWREDPPPYSAGFKYSALIRETRQTAPLKQVISSMPALKRRSMKPSPLKPKF